MRLLFDRWSHDNQPRWAPLDKPDLCLRIPCVVSRTEVSLSRRLLPCSPPMVQSAPQWWRAWLCQTVSQCLVVPRYARCDVGSEELLLGQQPSSSPLHLWGTFALVVCWLVEVGPLLLGGNWCMALGLGWAARWPPYTGFQLSQPVWRALCYGTMCTSEVNSHRMKEHAAGSLLQTCTSRRCHLLWTPLLVVSRGGKEVVGGAKKERQGEGFHSHQGRLWQFSGLSFLPVHPCALLGLTSSSGHSLLFLDHLEFCYDHVSMAPAVLAGEPSMRGTS